MSSEDNNGWCTIESDPAVFTEMIANVGVKDVVVEELIVNDPAMVRELGETQYGLVLLFKYTPQVGRLPRNVMPDAPDVYFAKQVISNACATQAIINTILNHSDAIELGAELSNFHEFTQHLPPVMRGEMVGQQDKLREVHNSFSRTSMFSFEDDRRRKDDDKEEAYHFVTFTFKNDAVWELDGLRDGPVFIDSATPNTWVDIACAAIQARIEELAALDTSGSGQGISFALLAIVKDKLPSLRKRKQEADEKGEHDVTAALQEQIAVIEEARERGRQENIRRRHNYFPAIIAYLRALRDDSVANAGSGEGATTNRLKLAVEAAKDKVQQQEAQKKAKK